MFEIFETYIKARGEFSEDDLSILRSLSTEKRVRRKELLLREGEVCQYKMFIAKGLLKTYSLKNDGTEHIMRFSTENSWTTDHDSLTKQTPSVLNIEALENSEVILWTRKSVAEIHTRVPAFKTYTEKLIENTLRLTQERILKNLSYTSEEKYEDFVNSYPDVFRRVPLHMVASYLGVSRETLSRIRQGKVKQ